jgi:hypothetical protein
MNPRTLSFLGAAAGSLAAYLASRHAMNPALPPYPSGHPVGTRPEGTPCGPGLFGDAGSCDPGLRCEPDLFGGTCVGPAYDAALERSQRLGLVFAVAGGVAGYYAFSSTAVRRAWR